MLTTELCVFIATWRYQYEPFRTNNPKNIPQNISYENCSHFWDIFKTVTFFKFIYTENVFLEHAELWRLADQSPHAYSLDHLRAGVMRVRVWQAGETNLRTCLDEHADFMYRRWFHVRELLQTGGIWQHISTATVLFRLCALPNSAEYPLRSLVEFHAVSDTTQT